MRLSFKFGVWLVCVFRLISVAAPAMPEIAPVNPEFIEYMQRKSLPALAASPIDAPALGLMPSVMNWSHLKYARLQNALRGSMPEAYDLRDEGKLTPVRNQGSYGTCWAFSAYGSMESCLLPDEPRDFSENNLVNLHGFDLGFNAGGMPEMALAYWARWSGPVNESDDPYPFPGRSPSGLPRQKNLQNTLILGGRVDAADNDNIKQAIMEHGALDVGMYWSDNTYNEDTHAFYYNGTEYENHGVAIVGWDDDYSPANFSSAPPGAGAFIVRNSWGTNWGDNGYFYISYHDTRVASTRTFLYYGVDETNNYDQIYQHDPLGLVAAMTVNGSHTASAANIFTATSNLLLRGVSFYLLSDNSSYEIKIYKDVQSDNPVSGRLIRTITGSRPHAGYYTVSLPYQTLEIAPGMRFSVVVKFDTPGYNYPIPVEFAWPGYSSAATSEPGQSFLLYNGAWVDATEFDPTLNVCIKVFANAYPWVQGVSASRGEYPDRVRISWQSVPDAAWYQVFRDTNPNPVVPHLIANFTNGVSTYYDLGAAPGTLYYYWVVAAGTKFGVRAEGFVSLPAPTALAASDGIYLDQVYLTWGAAAGANSYAVWRGETDNSGSAEKIGETSSYILRFTDSTALPGIIYYYWVKSTTSFTESPFSDSETGYVKFPSPNGFTASDGVYTDRIALTWNSAPSARSYQIWRSTMPVWNTATVITETGDLGYDDITATPGRDYYYWITSRNVNIISDPSPMATGWRRSHAVNRNITSDFDGDGIMDPAVYKEATGAWLIMLSGRNHVVITEYLGGPGWRPVPGDYDGDGITDLAVYAPATGAWQARLSSSGQLVSASLGGPGYLPVPGDYDGDGRTDPAVYHELTGYWTALLSSSSYAPVSALLGGPGYLPVPGDFDGDGRTDPAVYQPREIHAGWSIGYWAALFSGRNYNMAEGYFGDSPQIPVPADYNGNRRSAPATYRSTDGQWSIGPSGSGPLVPNHILGGPGYLPVPGDYDGDGRADLVVYNEATGTWLAKLSGRGYSLVSALLGGPGYTPVGR